MKLGVHKKLPAFAYNARRNHLHQQRPYFTSFLRKLHTTQAGASFDGGSSSDSQWNPYLVPGATVATIFMLGALHARRLYNDKKIEEAREKGIKLDLKPDVKFPEIATSSPHLTFLGYIDQCDLEEAAMRLDQYKSLKDFFVRTLKEGSRPVDYGKNCLVSPVDGTVLRFGELKDAGAMIEQVKGFSYSASALIRGSSVFPVKIVDDTQEENSGEENIPRDESRSSMKGLFYCIIYLRPGDYHRIHSPVDWNVLVRRHFPGRLFPLNERATRTVRNLYVENERVVLEGQWQEGYMAMAVIGATNIGSIEVAAFNMGSTVVLVFQAPVSKVHKDEGSSSKFRFCVSKGDKIRMGEALGRWHDS